MSFDVVALGLIALIAVAIFLLLRKPKKSNSRSRSASTSGPHAEVRQQKASATQVAFSEREPEVAPVMPDALQTLRLVTVDDVEADVQVNVQSICEKMPEPHPVQRQLAGGLDTPDDLIDAVTSDAGLTAGILSTVNSAAFSLASPITSVQHAITYLGVSLVKSLVAQAALADRAGEGTPEQQAALTRIWASAGAASAVASLLGQELGAERPSVIATKALFFNLGDVAMVLGVDGASAWYQEGSTLVERITAQQAACGANSAMVGSQLARSWGLPEDIANAVEDGFLPLARDATSLSCEADARRSSILMYLAGRIGDQVAFHGLRDLGELDLDDPREAELFYMHGHLEASGLAAVSEILKAPAFRRKAQRLLSTLNA